MNKILKRIYAQKNLIAMKKKGERKCKNCKYYNGNGCCLHACLDGKPVETDDENICCDHKYPKEKYQHNVMEIENSCCIRVCADTLVWMDCIFIVDREEKEKALLVLNKAYDDLWTEETNCFEFGVLFRRRLKEAGIKYKAFFYLYE